MIRPSPLAVVLSHAQAGPGEVGSGRPRIQQGGEVLPSGGSIERRFTDDHLQQKEAAAARQKD